MYHYTFSGGDGLTLFLAALSERWYSPKLQTEVLVKSNDPWNGETTDKLMGIDQSEPPASLFQVPADYSIVDMAEKAIMIIKEAELYR
jgi:hypothetical protein